MLKVLFISRKEAEAMAPVQSWALISINGLEPAKIHSGWKELLRLEFDDVDVEEDPYILFNEVHARMIVEFVKRCDSAGIEGILVHCHAGISRSAAVARWISDTYRLPFPESYMLYNKHVYRVLTGLDRPGY